MDKDAKFLNKILVNQMQQYMKRIDTIIKWDLSQSYKASSTLEKSSIIIYHINRQKKKNHMIKSIDAGKIWDKI